MDQLLLTANKLEGEIPVDIYDLRGLTRLELERNNLEGILLPEVRNWELLQVMYINHNKLSGELPSGTCGKPLFFCWDSFTHFRFPELGTLVNLRKATFNQNFFSGPIPEELGNLVDLRKYMGVCMKSTTFDHSHLVYLPRLQESIKFAQNDFTGAVPSSLCDIRIPSVTADCLLNPDTNKTEVTCSCCTRCCADGKMCQDV